MAFNRLSTQDCLDWLRQKTRTASSPTSKQGEWTDAVIVRYLNAAVREITTRMMTTPWAPYFIATELNQQTASGALVVGLSVSQQYAVIKVAWVQLGAGAGADAGKFLSQMSVNRLAYTANYGVRDGMGKVGDKQFYIVRQIDHEASPTGGTRTILQLFNITSQPFLDVYFYCFPQQLTGAVPATEYIGLPPVAWNALLSYALILMTEDERHDELRSWAEGRFQAEMQAVMLAAPTSFDLPDSLLGPAPAPVR